VLILLVLSLVMLFVCIVMPLGFAWSLWRADEASLAGWLVTAGYAVVFIFLIMTVGRWDVAGAYGRIPLVALFGLALILSLLHHRKKPWRAPDGRPLWRSHWATLLPLAVFLAGAIHVGIGLVPPAGAHRLALPLDGGRFMVGHGGGSLLINYHHPHPAQRHAIDITGLNAFGFRADGLHPDDVGRYAIFGKPVVSPCDGEVVEAADGLPDLPPPQTDPENASGNHVVIACQGLLVLLAHLRQGSVAVEPGEAIETGQKLGEVGNSGNTTEPHLHIHAVLEHTGDVLMGEAAPILLDGRHAVRNSTLPPLKQLSPAPRVGAAFAGATRETFSRIASL
jgi:hypothetical protein